MEKALQLAQRALWTARPNPMVGCVIVSNGEVVGEGYHVRRGGPHAEVVALQQAGARARGATVYVTLEPCAHVGLTPACAPQLVQAGVARVVAASLDPFANVAGRGFEVLRRAGVQVDIGLLADSAHVLNPRVSQYRLESLLVATRQNHVLQRLQMDPARRQQPE